MLLLCQSDAWTTIRDADHQCFLLDLDTHVNRRSRRCIVDGIGDEVCDHLLNQDRVYFYWWNMIRQVCLDRPSFQQRLHTIQDITEESSAERRASVCWSTLTRRLSCRRCPRSMTATACSRNVEKNTALGVG